MSKKGGRGGKKQHRFGAKQKHGSSRAGYFASRQLWRAAANKARRIAKALKQQKG